MPLLSFVLAVLDRDPAANRPDRNTPEIAVIPASLLHTGLDATIVTHDANMRAVAEVLGYPTVDPVAD